MNTSALSEKEKSAKTLTTVLYALHAAGGLTFGITGIVAIVLNYLKKEEVAGTWLESHFRWQIRTFWFALLWGAVGFVTLLVGIGFLILLADGVWVIYRLVVGFLKLNENKPMYAAA